MGSKRTGTWKRILIIAVATILLGLGRNYLFPGGISVMEVRQSSATQDTLTVEIDRSEAYRLFRNDAVFIDARGQSKYAESHIPGALHLAAAASMEEKSKVIDRLSPKNTYVIYCNNPECPLGDQVYEFMQMMGFSNLHIFTAGFEGWQEAGYPVTGEE